MPTPRGYRYPSGGDAPAGPLQMQELAEDVDADVTDVVADQLEVTNALDTRVAALEAVKPNTPGHPHREHVQSVNVTILSGSNTATASLTFPSGRFTQTPKLLASIDNSSSGAMTAAVASSVTAGTVRVSTVANVGANTTIPVVIHAIQMTSASAVG